MKNRIDQNDREFFFLSKTVFLFSSFAFSAHSFASSAVKTIGFFYRRERSGLLLFLTSQQIIVYEEVASICSNVGTVLSGFLMRHYLG